MADRSAGHGCRCAARRSNEAVNLNKRLDKIQALIEAQSKAQSKEITCNFYELQKSEETTRQECTEKQLDLLMKDKADDHKIWGVYMPGVNDLIFRFAAILSFAASIAAFISIRQSVNATKETRKNNEEYKEVVKEQKVTQKKLGISTDQIKSVTWQGLAANYEQKQSAEIQTALTMVGFTKEALEINRIALGQGFSIDRDERIGPFPDLYHYITKRIQGAQKLVVITMPFYQFGVLGNPQGLHDFHHTLSKRFKNAAGGDGPRLIVITYENKSRLEMARKRYSRAIHALNAFDDTPLSEKLKCVYNKKVWRDNLLQKLDDFRGELSKYEGSREILAELAKKQATFCEDEMGLPLEKVKKKAEEYKIIYNRLITYKEAMDLMLIEHLEEELEKARNTFGFPEEVEEALREPQKKRNLFCKLNETRDSFSKAVEAQEAIYFNRGEPWDGTGTPWPLGATIVEVTRDELTPKSSANGELTRDESFDNEMTIYVDGEIIRATSSLDPADTSHTNQLVGESGEEAIEKYTKKIDRFFKIAGQEVLFQELKQEFEKNLPRVMQDWPGMTSFEV